MRLEIGAGEKPHPDYDLHVDLLALPDIEVRCSIDRLPVRDRLDRRAAGQPRAGAPELRADLGRRCASGPGCCDPGRRWTSACRTPGSWPSSGCAGEIDTAEANHWILGGHSERAAHQGVDARGVPLWIWNAHHTMFDAESLRAAVAEFFAVDELFTYDIRNLRLYGRKR